MGNREDERQESTQSITSGDANLGIPGRKRGADRITLLKESRWEVLNKIRTK